MRQHVSFQNITRISKATLCIFLLSYLPSVSNAQGRLLLLSINIRLDLCTNIHIYNIFTDNNSRTKKETKKTVNPKRFSNNIPGKFQP